MKPLRLFCLFIFLSSCSFGQDTVRVDNAFYSAYEKLKHQRTSVVGEQASRLWQYKNLAISNVQLTSGAGDVLATALRFQSRNADGQLRLIPDEAYGYLDTDEVDSLIDALAVFLNEAKTKSAVSEKTFTYTSRGAVYAMCYSKGNRWRVVMGATPERWTYATWLSKEKVQELLQVLQAYRSGSVAAKTNLPER